MNPKDMEEKFSIDLEACMTEIEDNNDKLMSQEYSQLLELGKNLMDKDFSRDSDKEKVLKNTLQSMNQCKGEIPMKKANKFRKVFAAAAALGVVCIMSISLIQPSFAHNIVEKVINTISLGHIKAIQVEPAGYQQENFPVPEVLKGKLFDEEGKEVEVFSSQYTGKFYTADGEEIVDMCFTTGEITTVGMRDERVLVIKDLSKLNQYTCFEVLLPSYLPEDYQFDRAEFYKDEDGAVNNSKYISLYFTNNKTGKYIYMQQRFADEETAYEMATDGKIEKIKINGADAIISDNRSIDWEANNTLYMLSGRGEISKAELIKIAESIK
ncbi:DUF4367 domain-containing protein [Clostridium formicaceticum]|uniref:DUF4367 domain-containing protein n=1 Tax=Clostridium formicaceticum TaxID=1497 RepID=A0AAC9WEV2_9CLOT|nr:DUF4367 domain-containing protein [Clostridium formicaceticum]AOY75802.1 hypothetical protein BJL90_07750 [Clostridium formicaceticum]ARE86131.1 hypothetical protein CLFO_04470 [Clostridium formicaceticum]